MQPKSFFFSETAVGKKKSGVLGISEPQRCHICFENETWVFIRVVFSEYLNSCRLTMNDWIITPLPVQTAGPGLNCLNQPVLWFPQSDKPRNLCNTKPACSNILYLTENILVNLRKLKVLPLTAVERKKIIIPFSVLCSRIKLVMFNHFLGMEIDVYKERICMLVLSLDQFFLIF